MAKIRVIKGGGVVAEVGVDPLEHATYSDRVRSDVDQLGRPMPPREFVSRAERNITSVVGSATLFKAFGESLGWSVEDQDGQLVGIIDVFVGTTAVDLIGITNDGVMLPSYSMNWKAGGEPRETLCATAIHRNEKLLVTQDFVAGTVIRKHK